MGAALERLMTTTMIHFDSQPRTSGSQVGECGDSPIEELRALAMRADAVSHETVELSQVWRGLVGRSETVSDHFQTPERHYVLLQRSAMALARRPLRAQVLERVLLGDSQKSVAIERQLAASTIAVASKEALRAMGVQTSTSRAPFSIGLLVHAHHELAVISKGRVSHLPPGSGLRVVSIPRLDKWLCATLSPSEFEVLRLRADGLSHAEIARCRRSSLRTVANQVAAAFRKLGVSGRTELISYLARGGTRLRAPGSAPASEDRLTMSEGVPSAVAV
jgi:DNA-binding NarL/FixJ family response regulator